MAGTTRWTAVLPVLMMLVCPLAIGGSQQRIDGAVIAPPASARAEKYPTIEINPAAVHEDQVHGVLYLDEEQRQLRRVRIEGGVVYDHDGSIYPDTRNAHDDQFNYVMDAAGQFYLFDEYTTPSVRHSSIFAGGPVAGAGNIKIRGGRIVYIDAHSGHYPQSGTVFPNVLAELAARGVDVSSLLRR